MKKYPYPSGVLLGEKCSQCFRKTAFACFNCNVPRDLELLTTLVTREKHFHFLFDYQTLSVWLCAHAFSMNNRTGKHVMHFIGTDIVPLFIKQLGLLFIFNFTGIFLFFIRSYSFFLFGLIYGALKMQKKCNIPIQFTRFNKMLIYVQLQGIYFSNRTNCTVYTIHKDAQIVYKKYFTVVSFHSFLLAMPFPRRSQSHMHDSCIMKSKKNM